MRFSAIWSKPFPRIAASWREWSSACLFALYCLRKISSRSFELAAARSCLCTFCLRIVAALWTACVLVSLARIFTTGWMIIETKRRSDLDAVLSGSPFERKAIPAPHWRFAALFSSHLARPLSRSIHIQVSFSQLSAQRAFVSP